MKLLTKREAAALCRVSLAAFDAHVRPILTPKRIGRRVLFLQADIEAWAESLERDARTKPGRSRDPRQNQIGRPASPLLVALQSDPRALEMRTKLTRKLRSSLRRREQESSEAPAEQGAKVLRLPSRTS